MEIDKLISAIVERVDTVILKDEPLRYHTSFGIGGPASAYAAVNDAQEASSLLLAAEDLGIPLLILGGGTNLLVSDDGFEGLAIATRFNDLSIDSDRGTVTVGSTVSSAELVETLVSSGFAGLEFAAGLPGSVGGAVAGNAGCFGATFGERLVGATVVDRRGSVQQIADPAWFGFDYRRSRLQDGIAILVDVTFQISPGDPQKLREIADGHLETRRTKHPGKGVRTAGSYFKNLPPASEGEWRQPAGALLDQVGAKEMSVGDAAVFEKHANILINRGNATARDVLTLEAILKQKVFERFGVMLEPEVRFAGRRPVL